MQYPSISDSQSSTKKIKVTYNGEIKTTSNVTSLKDMVRYMCQVSEKEYINQLPPGVSSDLRSDNWFCFWY